MGNPTRLLRDHISNAGNLRGLPRDHAITREESSGPVSVAPAAAGAIQAEPHEFLPMNVKGEVRRPLEGKEYKVWELQQRDVQEHAFSPSHASRSAGSSGST